MYVIKYQNALDPVAVAAELETLPQVESASVNHLVEFTYHGTNRFQVSDTTEFELQWNLDSPRDSIDIDAPEAWIITQGDPDLVIGIIDTGTMLDTTQTPWKLHSDFNFLWIDAEDSLSSGTLSWDDIDLDDDNGDLINDNIIGASWATAPSPKPPPPAVELGLWSAIPNNYALRNYESWEIFQLLLHGLYTSSIAAATLGGQNAVGIAHNSRVYIARDGEVTISVADFVQMIDHVASVASVINMSWGLHEPFLDVDEDMRDAIADAAEEDDCVLVASAGNEYSDSLVSWPASDPNVLGVGSIDSNLAWNSYSNYGSEGDIDVVAIGDFIWVDATTQCSDDPQFGYDPCSDPLTETTEATGQGTSFAAPQAAGVAMLVRSHFPNLTQDEVRNRIERSSYFYWDDTTSNRKKYGAGYINAYRALTEWGELAETMTWEPADVHDGAYYISGDLVIPAGQTLTIDAGTAVRVAPDHEKAGADTNRVQIVVEGTLVVEGTAANPVVFESFTDTTSQTDDWVGIVFTSTSTNSSLDHVVIRNAQVGVETHVPITITNSRFEDCEIGVEAWDDVTIRGSTITDVEDYGVWIREGSGTLVADSILSSGAYGVAAYPDTSTDVTSVSLRDCVVSDNDGYGVWSWGATTSSTLRQCDIYDNDVAGLTFAANHTADVESCLVHNNNIGLSQAVGTAAIDFKFVTFEGNTTGVNAYSSNAVSLEADTLRDNTVGLYCYSASPSVKNGNYVRGNDEGIKCDQYSNAVVESTTVWFNDVGVVSLNGSNPDLGHESGGSSEGYNSFVSSTTYHVENRDTNVTVMAEENWWKYATGPDTSKVHGPVDFIPWLGTAPSLVPESRPGPEVVDLTRYPLRYELSYNYPNPFNPVTSVRYEVPPPGGPVTVSIFNVQGKLIRTLVEGTRRPGVYRLQWDGIDRTGAQVASGVYFLRMQAVGYQSVKKIVLIK